MNCRQRYIDVLLVVLFLCVPRGGAEAQTFGSDFHTVTVQVAAVTEVRIEGGAVNLSISAANAIAGEDIMTMTDQSTSLLWGTNSSGRKITVATNLVAPRYTLTLVALNPTQGTPATAVTLSTTPDNLLYDIGRSSGSCVLQYTGTAYASQGTGSDLHTITFTVQSQ